MLKPLTVPSVFRAKGRRIADVRSIIPTVPAIASAVS
jgi:hypothetical protein